MYSILKNIVYIFLECDNIFYQKLNQTFSLLHSVIYTHTGCSPIQTQFEGLK